MIKCYILHCEIGCCRDCSQADGCMEKCLGASDPQCIYAEDDKKENTEE